MYLCHCENLRGGRVTKVLYLSTWYLRLCEPHWPQATWSSSGRKAMETNKSQRTFLPRRSFPCLCLMGTQAVIALAPSCLLVLEGLRYCYLASLPGLPASVQLHPSPSSRMISSYPELSGMFFPPLSGMGDSFSLFSLLSRNVAQFIFSLSKRTM